MSKSRKTQKLASNDNIARELNIKNIGKVRISKPTNTRELVAFDIGLWFKNDTQEIQIYIDSDLQKALKGLLEQHGELIMKVNYFSDDLAVIVPDTTMTTKPSE